MRDRPHVAPGALTVIIGLTGLAFGSLGLDVLCTTFLFTIIKADFTLNVTILVACAVSPTFARLT